MIGLFGLGLAVFRGRIVVEIGKLLPRRSAGQLALVFLDFGSAEVDLVFRSVILGSLDPDALLTAEIVEV